MWMSTKQEQTDLTILCMKMRTKHNNQVQTVTKMSTSPTNAYKKWVQNKYISQIFLNLFGQLYKMSTKQVHLSFHQWNFSDKQFKMNTHLYSKHLKLRHDKP